MTEHITPKTNQAGEPVLLFNCYAKGQTFSGIFHDLEEAHADRDAWLRSIGYTPDRVMTEQRMDV